MSFSLPSISGLERAENCSGSVVLPKAHAAASVHTNTGKEVHAFVVRAREVGREEALAEIVSDADHRTFCRDLPLDKLPQGGRLETAYAYDPQTEASRVLGNNIGREYLKAGLDPQREIAGTSDIDGVVGDTVYLRDWKTGHKRLGDPRESWQLRVLALAAARQRGLDKADIGFFYLREDGSFYEDKALLGPMDLADIADEVRALVGAVRAAQAQYTRGHVPDVNLGPWCDYCASVPHCPGQVALARSLVRFEEPGELTLEKAAEAWAILAAYDQISERVKKGLREFAKLNPIPLPGGKELRLVQWPSTHIDTTIAKAVLVEKFGAGVAEDAVEKTITQASVERAIKGLAVAQGKPLAPLKREVLTEIEVRRGLHVSTMPQVRASSVPKEKKPKKVKLSIDAKAKDAKPVVEIIDTADAPPAELAKVDAKTEDCISAPPPGPGLSNIIVEQPDGTKRRLTEEEIANFEHGMNDVPRLDPEVGDVVF